MRKEYRNYKSYSNKEPIKEEVKKDDVPVVEAGPVEEPKSTWKGKVVNCEMVNVRSKASRDYNTPITAVLPKDQEVTVDLKKSTDDYYAVETEQHVDGFIKRDFLFVYEE